MKDKDELIKSILKNIMAGKMPEGKDLAEKMKKKGKGITVIEITKSRPVDMDEIEEMEDEDSEYSPASGLKRLAERVKKNRKGK